MKRVPLFALFLACLASSAIAQTETAKGVVYDDANGNGARDPGERGVSGVLVSNGMDIVKTDRGGNYQVPVSEDAIVFVIKPRGWMNPVGPGDSVPRFYHIHKPGGSPEMRHAGVPPTGPLPASIDFPLRRQKEGKRFKVLCMGDTQTRNVDEVQFLANGLLAELHGTDAVFGIVLGDNVFDDLSVFAPLVETMGGLGIPWRHVPGNHDHNHDAPTAAATDDTFERFFGPSHYSFNYGPVHFIVLNNIRHNVGKDGYHGGLGERQLAFLRNDLAHVSPGQLVVLLMHIPVMSLDDTRALYETLKDFPHTLSLSAHTHNQRHEFIGAADGWKGKTPHHHIVHGTACGSWWGGNLDEAGIPIAQMSDGGPRNYSLISFNGAKYDVEFRVPGRPADYQMSLWLPERIPAARSAGTEVVANVFAGSEKSRVEMRVEGSGKWTAMARFTGQDPHLVRALGRQDAFLAKVAELRGVTEIDKAFAGQAHRDFNMITRRLSGPADTGHLWRAALPAGLAPGSHVVTVRTTDMFGRSYSAARMFVVTE
ncbi:MAG: calcineurin-like phosphoesterase C-terminal domain-containing protein [Candidatus Hydrogenedentes bacterium]|nr:calcineurin-like phosphoesterase C-terminal domain-containing protein [Candidatus Hydrogenedentota bacterium]